MISPKVCFDKKIRIIPNSIFWEMQITLRNIVIINIIVSFSIKKTEKYWFLALIATYRQKQQYCFHISLTVEFHQMLEL